MRRRERVDGRGDGQGDAGDDRGGWPWPHGGVQTVNTSGAAGRRCLLVPQHPSASCPTRACSSCRSPGCSFMRMWMSGLCGARGCAATQQAATKRCRVWAQPRHGMQPAPPSLVPVAPSCPRDPMRRTCWRSRSRRGSPPPAGASARAPRQDTAWEAAGSTNRSKKQPGCPTAGPRRVSVGQRGCISAPRSGGQHAPLGPSAAAKAPRPGCSVMCRAQLTSCQLRTGSTK